VDAGLLFLRARYYDPGSGRFVSRDPFAGYLRLPQTQNEYVYVVNRSTLFIDPSGLDWKRPTGAEGIAIHKMIEMEYLAEAGVHGRVADREVKIPFANKQPDVTRLIWLASNLCIRAVREPEDLLSFGKADILDYTLREVYEIKHMPSWVVGQADVIWYVVALNKLPDEVRAVRGFGPPNWTPGMSYPKAPRLIGPWPTDPEAQVWAKQAGWGVIGYWGIKKEQERRRQPKPELEFEPVPVLDRNPLPEREDQRDLQPAIEAGAKASFWATVGGTVVYVLWNSKGCLGGPWGCLIDWVTPGF
jgi:RHS repeat-associated protein